MYSIVGHFERSEEAHWAEVMSRDASVALLPQHDELKKVRHSEFISESYQL